MTFSRTAALLVGVRSEAKELSCAARHGDASRAAAIAPAPPNGTRGETRIVELAVGAHQRHLDADLLRGPIACGERHDVPTSTGHGTVAWTQVDGARVACGSYHGAPPPSEAGHPTVARSYDTATKSCSPTRHASTTW